ncbi:MAG: Na(+)/H(+) antiporter subunit D [Candidatus Dadabacteria bacterium]|nr:MAG: Na(+)/H(+) antiporter subunit D [Candidatus Dadabacteria bacterium]
MSEPLHPVLIFYFSALLISLFSSRKIVQLLVIIIPLFGLLNLYSLPDGSYHQFTLHGFHFLALNIDPLSRIFAYIFHIAVCITLIYTTAFDDTSKLAFGFFYAGSALGVVFAGDFLTFYIFWELLTLSAVAILLKRKTDRAARAGIHYLLTHVVGGLALLSGVILHYLDYGSLQMIRLSLSGTAEWLIFMGLGVMCAFPLLHCWLTDSYPEASISGTVFLSIFTTKSAVYSLARIFPGQSELIWIGAVMTIFPIFYAVIENDLRRVLSYSLINQVGFMVIGIGLGTYLSINGAVAHVFTHILYKSLLFMSIGAVMFRTGTARATGLGGLARSMPFTTACCIIGAASISAVPFFSGFASKSLVVSAAADGHHLALWLVLLFASAGVFHHAGIKVPFFAFFSHDSGLRVKEAPLPMLAAMGIAAFLCVIIGVFPEYTLYPLLPYPVSYNPYTAAHIVSQFELLSFAALAFTLLLLSGIYPAEMRATNLDFDWFYRKAASWLIVAAGVIVAATSKLLELAGKMLVSVYHRLRTLPDYLVYTTGLKSTVRPIGESLALALLFMTALIFIM